MNERIFARFKENNKWSDYLNFESFECKMSFIFMLIILFSFTVLDVYDKFSIFNPSLQNITIYIAQALIGMLGIILAGIAIVVGLLSKDSKDAIDKHNGKGSLQKVLVSFEFLIFNIAIGIFLFFLINLILHSDEGLMPLWLFNVFISFVSYFLAFIIFYTVALVGNSIKLFYIDELYTTISEKEKSLYEKANEVRIDYLLYYLQKDTNLSPEEIIEDIEKFVDMTNISDKESVKSYLKKYYTS